MIFPPVDLMTAAGERYRGSPFKRAEEMALSFMHLMQKHPNRFVAYVIAILAIIAVCIVPSTITVDIKIAIGATTGALHVFFFIIYWEELFPQRPPLSRDPPAQVFRPPPSRKDRDDVKKAECTRPTPILIDGRAQLTPLVKKSQNECQVLLQHLSYGGHIPNSTDYAKFEKNPSLMPHPVIQVEHLEQTHLFFRVKNVANGKFHAIILTFSGNEWISRGYPTIPASPGDWVERSRNPLFRKLQEMVFGRVCDSFQLA